MEGIGEPVHHESAKSMRKASLNMPNILEHEESQDEII